MPTRGKRATRDFDPNKSDSDDETYGASAARTSRPRPSKSRTSKPARRQRKRAYDGGDSSEDEDISESDLSGLDPYVDSAEEEEVEVGASGRPKRKAVKNTKPIVDEDSDEIEDDEDVLLDKPTIRRTKPQPKWVTLTYTPGKSPIATDQHKRSDRTRSSSAQPMRPTSSGVDMERTRRSSRRGHDNAEIVASTRDAPEPPEASKRPTRGGKGPKKGLAQTQETDGGDESSGRIKDQQSTDELQRDHYRLEIAESRENLVEDLEEQEEHIDVRESGDLVVDEDQEPVETTEIPESVEGNNDAEDDEDEGPITRSSRMTRQQESKRSPAAEDNGQPRQGRKTVLGKRKSRGSQKTAHQESSDFEPAGEEAEEEDVSDSETSASPRKTSQDDGDYSSPGRRGAKRRRPNTRSRRVSDESDEREELLDELGELNPRKRRNIGIIMEERSRVRRRRDNKVNYDIMASNAALARAIEENEDEEPVQSTPSKRTRATGHNGRSLFSTFGPFGGTEGMPPVLGGPAGLGAVGGADSDSSDDEIMQRPRHTGTGLGGTVGMTPTTAHPGGGGIFPGAFGAEAAQGVGGTPANLGKLKDKQALADADPLGVDQNVSFDSVGGLQGHINQLKEMVMLPLLYPEVFQRFHVTPPRGVLFHGPPGTGKTLLARALATSVSSQGKKVTFYMRKGADALSKWVGEAERQLRMLFDEARKNQPSIIFFDEIDGLAPVRSSKQEQIHASIVSTLLALMDGMDGRGQVIVIGATNRPDSVDPALRRPGRFDREFYFPLPTTEARRAILDIHTKGWSPPLNAEFKDEIAKVTKGYGGADLRALCTEAALNAVQRRYPQIYKSDQKLQIRPETINVAPKDFMISVKTMIPSSERSALSGAAPLPSTIEPLLREPLEEIENLAAEILPRKKPLTALQEAEYEDADEDKGMATERIQQEFERSRVFRPRLLVKGPPGMGQQYLAGALLNHFEGLHVQAFDLATLLSDSTRSSEAAIVQLFTEVRRHKPSVIYIPNVDTWYSTVGHAVISTFCGLLRALPPAEPIMLLGILESDQDLSVETRNNLFGYSKKCQYEVRRPLGASRQEYFKPIKDYIESSPVDFPSPSERKLRKLEILPIAPPEPLKEPPPLTKAQLKAQKKKDRLLLNQVKIKIQPVMDQIKKSYRKFRLPVIDEKEIRYLFEEDDPDIVTSDLPQDQRPQEFRPFEKAQDDNGEQGLRETATGKFFYNLDIATIEKRLSNGYYKRPKDFTADVKKLCRDARSTTDDERLMKAKELLANVEVDVGTIELAEPYLIAELENVYQRELKRQKEMVEKAKRQAAEEGRKLYTIASNVPPQNTMGSSTDASSGPIKLGHPLTNGFVPHPITPSNPSTLSNGLSDLSNLDGRTQSNITSIPSREDIDVYMTNSDERPSTEKDSRTHSSFGPPAQTRPPESYTGLPVSLQQRKSIPNSLSQGGIITPLAPGSQPADYMNDASTTSSDKRNTGSSVDKGFGTQSQLTQDQSIRGPDMSMFHEQTEPNSQLPDTQISQSPLERHDSNEGNHSFQSQQPSQPEQGSSQPPAGSQPMQPPPSKAAITSILNAGPTPRHQVMAPTGLPPVNIDKPWNEVVFTDIVHKTSGCSVEQLEQLYSVMMNEVWKRKGEWDRVVVVNEVKKRFDEEMSDIEELQGIGQGTQQSDL